MAGYSLSFFSGVSGEAMNRWWDDLTPEIATKAAKRARKAGCVPYEGYGSGLRCGQPIAWTGPDISEVMRRLGPEMACGENAIAEILGN